LKNTPPLNLNKHCDFDALKYFNTPQACLPILGWTVACFFKPRILKFFGGFPVLNVFGEAGAGKTTTFREIITKIWALKYNPKAINAQSEFTLMRFVSLTNAIPLILEEHKGTDEKTKKNISGLIRDTYDGFSGHRGKPDQNLVHYKYEAPVAIIGEKGFSEPAALDRLVVVQMSGQESHPQKHKFDVAKQLPLENLGRSLLDFALQINDSEVEKQLICAEKAVSTELENRARNNAAVCRFGLYILSKVTSLDFTSDELSCIDKAVIAGISEDENRVQRKSSVDKIIEAMGAMSAFNMAVKLTDDRKEVEVRSYSFPADHLKPLVHYQSYYVNGVNQLRLWVAGAYPVFLKWARNYGFDGDLLDELSFKKHLKKEKYYINSMLSDIGQNRRRVFVLDLDVMNKKIDIPDEWTDQNTKTNTKRTQNEHLKLLN